MKLLQGQPISAGNNENEAALVQNWYGTDVDFAKYKRDYLKLYKETIEKIVQQDAYFGFQQHENNMQLCGALLVAFRDVALRRLFRDSILRV